MRQNATKVRQKSKIVMRQKWDKILRQKWDKIRIMSHQFCPTHAYHLTNTYNIKAWVYPRLLSCADGLYLPFHYTTHFLTCQILVYILVFFISEWNIFGRFLYWNFFIRENLNVEKICAYPSSLPKRGSGVSPIWPGEKFFEGPITFRTHIGAPILFTFRTYI